MVTVILSFLEGKFGMALFLLASVLCFVSVYFILMGERSDSYKVWKYGTIAASVILTDVMWMANRYLDTLHFANFTVAEKMIVDFATAGVMFFIAVAFISLFSSAKATKIRIVFCVILAISSAWSFINRLISSAGKAPVCLFGLGELGNSLFLVSVTMISILVLGYLSAKFDGLTSSQKALARGLGVIVVVMGVLIVVLTLRDMNVFEVSLSEHV